MSTTKLATYDAKVIRLAQTCQAHQDVRPFLNGIWLHPDGTVYGSDGHTAARSKNFQPSPLDFPVLINMKMISKLADLVLFDFGTNKAAVLRVLNDGSRKLINTLKFTVDESIGPDFDQVIPSDVPGAKPVDMIGLNAQYLSRLSVFADYGKYHGLKAHLRTPSDAAKFVPTDMDWHHSTCMVIMPMKLPK